MVLVFHYRVYYVLSLLTLQNPLQDIDPMIFIGILRMHAWTNPKPIATRYLGCGMFLLSPKKYSLKMNPVLVDMDLTYFMMDDSA